MTFPIKKWSAAGALLAAAFYLLLSGAEVATQRSFFVTAVVLIAVMVDRRAITFRTLAVAALIVGLTYGVAMLATLLPARLAGKISPAEALLDR